MKRGETNVSESAILTQEYAVDSQRGSAYVPFQLYERVVKADLEESPDHEEKLKDDQIEVLLLRLMALSNQYLLTPPQSKIEQETYYARVMQDLSGKKTDDELLDAFTALENDQMKQSIQTENSESAIASSEDEYKAVLRDQILDIMRYPQVRKRYKDELKKQREAAKSHRSSLRDITRVEQMRADAKRQFRELRGSHAFAFEKTKSGVRRRKNPGISPEVAGQYQRVIDAAMRKANQLVAGLSDEGRGVLAASRMHRRKEELETYGFTLSESREQLLDEINDLMARGFRVFLGGPTGTGKTTMACFAMREITEGKYEVISWSGETAVRDLFGSPKLTTDEKGLQTTMSMAPYTRAITGKTGGIVHEEMTSGSTTVKLSLKALWSAHPGSKIHIPGFNGNEFTKEELAEIATGNIRGRRHKEREEEDPAIAREFKALEVPFMPAKEMYEDVIAPELFDRAGFFPISRSDLEMVEQLCKAAELTQHVYLEQIPPDVTTSPIYQQLSPSGAKIQLTKVFLDTGTTKDLFAGWQTSGKPLQTYAREQLARFIFKNPHFRELEHERENVIKILRAYGFHFEEDQPFYTPSEKTKKITKYYILPTDMGFLVDAPKRSNEDEFGTGGNSIEITVEGKKMRAKQEPWINKDGETFQPDELFEIDGERYRYYGLDSDDKPIIVKESFEMTSSQNVTPLEGDLRAQIERAKSIMSEGHFFGPDEISALYSIVRQPDTIPPIPFDRDRMEREKKAGMVLRLVCDTASDGSPLTGQKIHELLSRRYEERGEKFLFDVDWYKDEPFFAVEKPQAGWVFTAKELLENSTSKNYVDQTICIADDMKARWQGGSMPEQDTKDISEWEAYYQKNFTGQTKAQIKSLLGGDATGKKYAKKLSDLGINKHNRPTAVELLEQLAFMREATDEFILSTSSGWTATRDSDGSLVFVGYFGADGARVYRWCPDRTDGLLGVLLSRR